MPPEEMTGSTHILEFMCYAIAGSAGIRFCMEMVMSSSSDASAQRCRARVGRRSGVLRGFAGAALRTGARAASRARRGRGPGPGARRRAVGPDAVRAERGAQARQSQRASKGPRVPQHPILVLLDVLHQTHGLPQVLRVAPRVRARREVGHLPAPDRVVLAGLGWPQFRACRLPDWVLAAARSSVVRAAVFYTVVMSLRINEVTGRAEKV